MIRSSAGACLIATALLVGCVGEHDAPSADAVAVTMHPIVGGVPASEYPEAAFLNIDPSATGMYVCSGTLISPTVILTAGHCVDGHGHWDVHVAGAYRKATRSALYDWYEQGAAGVNPAHHDVGLVFLDEPIPLHQFPTIARSVLTDNSSVTCVGRVLDGHINSSLYQADTEVSLGAPIGYPYDYQSDVIIQSGDSGGPVFRHGTHEIVAVNSGVGADLQVLARVDLLAGWIGMKLSAEDAKTRLSSPTNTAVGGTDSTVGDRALNWGVSQAQQSVDSDSARSARSDVGVPMSTDSGPHARLCSEVEVESNDSYDHANTIVGAACGSIRTGLDGDWFTLNLEAGRHRVELSASADATMHIGMISSVGCLFSYTNVNSVDVDVNGGSAKICLMVRSPQRQTQSYVLRAEPLPS